MFAFSNVAVRRGVISGSVFQALAITVPIGVPIFLIAAAASGFLGAVLGFSVDAVIFLMLAGFSHFVSGRYCSYRAINAIGSNLAAPLQQLSLVVSLGLAVVLLGESFTPLKILGIVCVVLGPAVMLRWRVAPRLRADGAANAFEPRFFEGYSFALLSTLGYGLSPILARSALVGTNPGIGLAGGLISYSAATAVVALIFLSAASRREIMSMSRLSAKWFTISGVFVCLAQMLRYMALTVAPVTVVTPIQRTTIVFRVLFGWFVNREFEIFGWRVIIGIFVSVLGAVALTLSTEFLLARLPLPDSLLAIVRWRWP